MGSDPACLGVEIRRDSGYVRYPFPLSPPPPPPYPPTNFPLAQNPSPGTNTSNSDPNPGINTTTPDIISAYSLNNGTDSAPLFNETEGGRDGPGCYRWHLWALDMNVTHMVISWPRLRIEGSGCIEVRDGGGGLLLNIGRVDEGKVFVVPGQEINIFWNSSNLLGQEWLLKYTVALPDDGKGGSERVMPFYSDYYYQSDSYYEFVEYNDIILIGNSSAISECEIVDGVIIETGKWLAVPEDYYNFNPLIVSSRTGRLFSRANDSVILIFDYDIANTDWIFYKTFSTPNFTISTFSYDELYDVLSVGDGISTLELYIGPEYTFLQRFELPVQYLFIKAFVRGILLVQGVDYYGHSFIQTYTKSQDCLNWMQIKDYELDSPDSIGFGTQVALNAANMDMIITDIYVESNYFEMNPRNSPVGVAYYYTWNGKYWTETQRLDSEMTDYLCGYATALNERYLLLSCKEHVFLYEKQNEESRWSLKKRIPYIVEPVGWVSNIPSVTDLAIQFKIKGNYVIIQFHQAWNEILQTFHLDCDPVICQELNLCVPPFECSEVCDAEGIIKYQCLCPKGHQQEDGNCIDINECLQLDVCNTNQHCVNSKGSYSCIEQTKSSLTENGTIFFQVYGKRNDVQFGSAIALSESILSISSPVGWNINPTRYSGFVYQYKPADDGASWVLSNVLTSPAPLYSISAVGVSEMFGISLSSYLEWTVVGSQKFNNDQFADIGNVFVYYKGELYQTLIPTHDLSFTGRYGHSVSIYGDMIVIGSPGAFNGTGIVYVYYKGKNAFELENVLYPPIPDVYGFGESVSVSFSGILVGAPDSISKKGIAFYYRGDNYRILLLPDSYTLNYKFGYSIAISIDHVLVASEGPNGGAVHVYDTGFAKYKQTLQPQNEEGFGRSIAIYDSNLIIGSSSGGVYYYTLSSNVWQNKLYYYRPPPFGSVVAISGDIAAIYGTEEGMNYVALTSVGCWYHSYYFSASQCKYYCPNGIMLFPLECENGPCTPGACEGDNVACVFSGNNRSCVCESGYQWDPIDKKCSDINECLQSHICEEACINTPGSYYCSCVFPSSLIPGSHNCYDIGVMLELIDPSLLSPGDGFGESIGIRYPFALIGAPGSNSSTGVVYIFKNVNYSWNLVGDLQLIDRELGIGYRFGSNIEMIGDWAIVTSRGDSSVNFFHLLDDRWINIQSFHYMDPFHFGRVISAMDTNLVITSDSALYFYALIDDLWTETSIEYIILLGNSAFFPGEQINYIMAKNEGYILRVDENTIITAHYTLNFGVSIPRLGETIKCYSDICAINFPEWNDKGGVMLFQDEERYAYYFNFLSSHNETNFGKSLAFTNLEDDIYLVVGSPGYDSSIGAVYLYDIYHNEEIMKLVPGSSDIMNFGSQVATDGNYILASGVSSTGMVFYYTRNCKEGYGWANCLDIDECALNLHNCEQNCSNTDGGFQCYCMEGFKSKNNLCEDIDECLIFSPCEQNCTNTRGSYYCYCREGFVKNGSRCDDIDECLNQTYICDQKCVNTPGSFYCSCYSGYQYNEIHKFCEDIDECSTSISPCNDSLCLNTQGSYLCHCLTGYNLTVNGSCVVNPCVTSEWSNWKPSESYGLNFIIRHREIDKIKSDGSPLCFGGTTPVYESLQIIYNTDDNINGAQVSYILRDSFNYQSWLKYQFLNYLDLPLSIQNIVLSSAFDLIIEFNTTSTQKREISNSDYLCPEQYQDILNNSTRKFLYSSINLMIPNLNLDRVSINLLHHNQCAISIHTIDFPPNTWEIIAIVVPIMTIVCILIIIFTILLTRQKLDLSILPDCFQEILKNYYDWEKKSKVLYFKLLQPDTPKYNAVQEMLYKYCGATDTLKFKTIHAVFNVTLFESFATQHKRMVSRMVESPSLFNSKKWINASAKEMKLWVYERFEMFIQSFPWNKADNVMPIVLMLHGTNLFTSWKICETGFVSLSTLDSGWYGKGIYFSSNIFYIHPYCNNTDPAIIMSLVIPGNPFPVTEHPRSSKTLEGAALRDAYQSHYVIVTEEGFPPEEEIPFYYDELVVNQEAQILPVFLLQPKRTTMKRMEILKQQFSKVKLELSNNIVNT